MITAAIELYRASSVFKYAFWFAVAMACVLGFAWDQQSKGAAKAVAKIERQDQTNVAKAGKAASASRDPRARGMLDPHQRDD